MESLQRSGVDVSHCYAVVTAARLPWLGFAEKTRHKKFRYVRSIGVVPCDNMRLTPVVMCPGVKPHHIPLEPYVNLRPVAGHLLSESPQPFDHDIISMTSLLTWLSA
jgi:hypothetical protein